MNLHTLSRAVALAAGALTLALAGALSVAPAHAADQPAPKPGPRIVAPVGDLTLYQRTVPVSEMPAAVRAALGAAHTSVTPASTTTVEELVSSAYPGMCVDANNAGSTAGQDGDIVQLWGCFNDEVNHPNQWWWTEQTDYGYTELINWQYGMCLDADNSHGFANGSQVQLWSCFNNQASHANQWWDFGPHGFYTTLPVQWNGISTELDANNAGSTAGQDGDKIQIWSYAGDANQIWFQ